MTGPHNLIPVRTPLGRPSSPHRPPTSTSPTPTTLSFSPVRPGDRGPGEVLGLASVSPPLTSQPSPHTPSSFRCARDRARCWGNKRNRTWPCPRAVMRRRRLKRRWADWSLEGQAHQDCTRTVKGEGRKHSDSHPTDNRNGQRVWRP